MRNFFIASVIALIATGTAFAQAPTINSFKPGQAPVCVPVGNTQSTITLIGSGAQQSSINHNIGGLLTDLKSMASIGGMQNTAVSVDLKLVGTDKLGGAVTIKNDGFTEGTVKQLGDGKLGSGSVAEGRLGNYSTVTITPEIGKLSGTVNLTGSGQLGHGTQAILGTINTVTQADLDAWEKNPAADKGVKPELGAVKGFSNGGYASTSGMGNFTYDVKANPVAGTTFKAGGEIKTFGQSYVNTIPNGFFSCGTSTTVINVPVVPTNVNIPTTK